MSVFGTAYNYKYIFQFMETGILDEYHDFSGALYSMISRLFKYFNFTGDILVPSIFQLWFQEYDDGRFLPESFLAENPILSVRQIKNMLPRAKELGKNLIIFIKIFYIGVDDGHANLLVFTPDKKIYVIEPNFTNLEDNLGDEEVRLMKSVKGFLTMYFPDYTFRKYSTHMQQVNVYNHYNMCAPISVLDYIYRNDTNYFDYSTVKEKLTSFVDFETVKFQDFYNYIRRKRDEYNVNNLPVKELTEITDPDMPIINDSIPSRTESTNLTNTSGVINPRYSDEVMSDYRQKDLPNSFGKLSEERYLRSFLKKKSM